MQRISASGKSSSSPVRDAKPAFNIGLLWIAFRKHWLWCVPLGAVLALGLGYAIAQSFVPEYEAIHLLEANRDYVVFRTNDDLVPRDLAKSERQLIMNGTVLDPVLSDASLRSAPSLSKPTTAERELRSRLSVGNGGTQNYLLITYRDRQPEQAARVCNAVAESYLRVREQSSVQRMNDIVDWLTPSIESWRAQIEEKRGVITELTQSASGYDPFKQASTVESDASNLSQLRSRLAELQAEEVVVKARKQALENSDIVVGSGHADAESVQRLIDSDLTVQKTRAKLNDVLTALRDLERKEQQHSLSGRYQRLKSEAGTVERDLKRAEETARENAAQAVIKLASEKATEERKQQVRELQFELLNLQAKREALTADYNAEKSRIEKMGGESAELFFAKEDYQQSAEILSQLNHRLAVLKTEQRRSNGIQSVAAAKPPTFPIEDLPYKKLLLASIVCMLLPFGAAILLELGTKRVVDSNGLEGSVDLPIIGEVARLTASGRGSRGQRMFEESIDALCSNLLFHLEGIRTIAVTSAMPAEGKSSVASQLAISLAKACDEPVLIIDADIRLPALHSLFSIELAPGLTRVLNGLTPIDAAIDKSRGPLVHVLPAGRLSGNPHHLLSRRNIEILLESIPPRYRYVIIDTSPILPAAETLALTASVDGTLLCAMRDVTRREHLSRAQSRLKLSGANVLGMVFSGIPAFQYTQRYGSYEYQYRLPQNRHTPAGS